MSVASFEAKKERERDNSPLSLIIYQIVRTGSPRLSYDEDRIYSSECASCEGFSLYLNRSEVNQQNKSSHCIVILFLSE